jgi:hypothetical protein
VLWFYLKNAAAAPFPNFTGCGGGGPPENEKKRFRDLLDAIALLKNHSLHGTSVIGAYHARRVALLMARALPLYKMTSGA